MKKIIAQGGLLVIVLGCVIAMTLQMMRPHLKTQDELVVLIPQRVVNNLLVQGWKNAAVEEGLHLKVMTDDNFLYSTTITPENYPGIILPDIIHNRISAIMITALKNYLQAGGHLMLVYDAATQNEKGHFFKDGAAFSDVLGISYGAKVNNNPPIIKLGFIGQTKEILDSIGVPPGKCIFGKTNTNDATPKANQFCEISSYGYGALTYSYFSTPPEEDTSNMLLTTAQKEFIAGVRDVGKGKILFVNTPLSSLWAGTDGLLIHGFLNYFAVEMLHLPLLSSVPKGIGGIIMNLHTESLDVLEGFEHLKKIGLFEQGPYSIDFTAGPDLDKPGDGKGPDVLHNLKTQQWIHYLAKLGNAIGSDGGWMHNYYGLHANENNQATFQKYITMNNDAMEKVLGHKVLEYVPSLGNQPQWARRYLEKEGFIAYYSVGNTGSAPTQNVYQSVMDSNQMWSFPLLPFGLYGCLRDFGFAKVDANLVTQWLLQSTKFVVRHNTARLIYYHPTDINFFPQYLDSLKQWLVLSKQLQEEGIFRWYSMVDIAQFLNLRRDVQWVVTNKENLQVITANHPISLNQQTWFIRKDSCEQPQWIKGTGTIKEDDKNWIVTAADVKNIKFSCRILQAVPEKVLPAIPMQQKNE